MPDMSRGKPHREASTGAKGALMKDLEWLLASGYTLASIAKALGLSRQIVTRWSREPRAFPRQGNLEELQKLVNKVRHEQSRQRSSPLDGSVARGPVVPVPPSYDPAMSAGLMGEHMAKMLMLRDLPQARYPELEVCLWYHREDLARGVVGPDVVVMAQGGRFDGLGCADWSAPRWWDEMRRANDRLQSEYGPASLLPPPSERPARAEVHIESRKPRG